MSFSSFYSFILYLFQHNSYLNVIDDWQIINYYVFYYSLGKHKICIFQLYMIDYSADFNLKSLSVEVSAQPKVRESVS